MRVGPPLTGPIDTLALQANGRGGRGGGRGGAGAAGRGAADTTGRGGAGAQGGPPGGGRGGADNNTFPAMPGRYIARLTLTPASGTPTVVEQSFALTKDPMVTMSEAELKQLYAFRLDVVKTQRTLREKQAQLDTAQRLLAAAKRAADSAGTKVTPELKTQLATVEKELADITREMGTPNAGRGGGGRGGPPAGGAVATGGGRGGRGGRGGAPVTQAGAATPAGAPAGGATPPVEDEQNPTAPQTPQNIQARLGTTTEMLGISFNPNPEQKKTLQALPAEIQKAGDRVSKVSSGSLPALIKALKDAGVEVKTP
jgi:hypothetical protein